MPPVVLDGLRFSALDLPGAVAAVREAAAGRRWQVVVTPNAAHFARLGSADADLRAAYETADFCFLDSRVLALAIRSAGRRPPPVVPGSDLVPALFRDTIRPETPVCLIGGEAETVAALRQRCGLKRLHHLNPTQGFWRDPAEVAAIIRFVVETAADYTFLAVGSPQQERLAQAIAADGGARGAGLCIGAAIEFVAGTQRRAPAVLRRTALEWAWRLVREPRRLGRRYLVESPRGVWHAWRAARRAPAAGAPPLTGALVALAATLLLGGAAPSLTVLYAFPGGAAGALPGGPLAMDAAGDLFGITSQGGMADNGVFYKLAPTRGKAGWYATVLASIPAADGYGHLAGVALRAPDGMAGASVAGGPAGCGAVLALGTGKRLRLGAPVVFHGQPKEGCYPRTTLVAGRDGTLYGTTSAGGAGDQGAVYALPPGAAISAAPAVWSFHGDDGSQPGAAVLGTGGVLYGTAYRGGAHGLGTVWIVLPPPHPWQPWTRTVLWHFRGAPDCASPSPGPLARDRRGHWFGACQAGGAQGRGGIFELIPPAAGKTGWSERIIADADSEIGTIVGGLAFDRAGRLIATSAAAADGGPRVLAVQPPAGKAVKSPIATLWRFPAGAGLSPVLVGRDGLLFGTTTKGGPASAGIVWSLAP